MIYFSKALTKSCMKIIRRYRKCSANTHGTAARSDDSSAVSDEQWWRQFTSGSKSAFEQLYYNHVNQLYDYGVRLSRDAQLSEDCVQDLFTYLWENQHKLPVVNAVKPYLLVSLKRRMYRKLADQRKDIIKICEALEPEAYGFNPELNDNSDSILALKQAFAKLSDKQKEVIYLRFYNQLSYEEIAEVMEVQVKAIYKLMARAIHTLKGNITHPIITHLLLAILAS